MDRPIFLTPDPEILLVTEAEEGIRVDRLLAERYPNHSRTYFQYLIEQGFVLLNGEQIKKRVAPEEGDELEVCFQYTPESPVEPESIPLQILYEDEHLIAVNKPVGMVVHPAPGHRSGTFVNALLGHCKQIASLQPAAAPFASKSTNVDLQSGFSDPLRPGIVHRLDKQTSGVLIAAKTAEAHQKLVEKFALREMEKTYLAICIGKPRSGLLSAPIGRHPVHRKEMTVLPDGKEAVSEIQVLAYNEKISLVLIKPKTGRTHQIRVHLKHLGTPVLGDEVYGQTKTNQTHKIERQLLHAHRLQFNHPITNAPVSLCAPLPQDMQIWMQQLAVQPICQ